VSDKNMTGDLNPPFYRMLGVSLISVSLMGLIGWFGTAEPDCYYTTELLLQYRYCAEESMKPLNHLVGMLLLSLLGIGVMLMMFGNRITRDRSKNGDSAE
jgi:hypothetical protein